MRFAMDWRSMERWLRVCAVDDIPVIGVHLVQAGTGEVALFRDAADRVIALAVSEGAVVAPGKGCAVTFPVRLEGDGSVMLLLRTFD